MCRSHESLTNSTSVHDKYGKVKEVRKVHTMVDQFSTNIYSKYEVLKKLFQYNFLEH